MRDGMRHCEWQWKSTLIGPHEPHVRPLMGGTYKLCLGEGASPKSTPDLISQSGILNRRDKNIQNGVRSLDCIDQVDVDLQPPPPNMGYFRMNGEFYRNGYL